ncbi:hypothetical protein SH412_005000 [Planctellipticum variicoloris]|nr:hypothetical protein SH412_005000 [Planctomycetaceae bacterium SH412]
MVINYRVFGPDGEVGQRPLDSQPQSGSGLTDFQFQSIAGRKALPPENAPRTDWNDAFDLDSIPFGAMFRLDAIESIE